MHNFIWIGGITLGSLLLIAGFLHLIPKLGSIGKTLSRWLCIAPGLDLVVGYFTALPLILGPVFGGWVGLAASVCGQVLAVMIWTTLHGLAHPKARKGPRIVKFLNALVGPWRNFIAVWITAFAVPVFILVRVAELLVYPWLVWLIRFPKYKQGEWVRVGRHKFENLVGHDLIWCLYCDWMTGVWSLGSEMLRNVESFWCPIRFDNEKKCANCQHDFPDIYDGWVKSDADMTAVTDVLTKQYGEAEINCWFGHPARLTVEGDETAMSESKRLVGFGVVPSEGPVRISDDPSDPLFVVERWTDSGWVKLSGPGRPTLADFAAGSSTVDRMRMEGISEEDLNSFK